MPLSLDYIMHPASKDRQGYLPKSGISEDSQVAFFRSMPYIGWRWAGYHHHIHIPNFLDSFKIAWSIVDSMCEKEYLISMTEVPWHSHICFQSDVAHK